MSTHTHSAAALAEISTYGSLGKRAAAILRAARRRATDPSFSGHRTFSDRDMLRDLGYTDMNAVRPRITELIAMGLLIPVDSVQDPATGKTVRRSRAATAAEITLHQQRHSPAQSERQLELI